MPSSPITGVGSPGRVTGAVAADTAAPSTTGATGVDQLANKDTFLKLMVAQLRYQNPLEPTDSAQFMQQTAAFTQLETLQNIQSSEAATSLWARMSAAQSMLGMDVEALDDTGAPITGVVTEVRPTTDGPLVTLHQADGTDLEVPLDYVTKVRPHATDDAKPDQSDKPATD